MSSVEVPRVAGDGAIIGTKLNVCAWYLAVHPLALGEKVCAEKLVLVLLAPKLTGTGGPLGRLGEGSADVGLAWASHMRGAE